MNVDDSVYFALDLETISGDPCEGTPQWTEEEPGLRIGAPGRVPLGGTVRIPICAVANFDAATRDNLPDQLWQHISVVVVDLETNVVYAQSLGDPSPIPSPEALAPTGPDGAAPVDIVPTDAPGEVAEDDEPDFVIEGGGLAQFRNFDLLDIVDLPTTPRRLYVHLTYGDQQSNTVEIRLEEQD